MAYDLLSQSRKLNKQEGWGVESGVKKSVRGHLLGTRKYEGILLPDVALDAEYFNSNLGSKKLYTPMEHPIILQKMILTVFRSFFL